MRIRQTFRFGNLPFIPNWRIYFFLDFQTSQKMNTFFFIMINLQILQKMTVMTMKFRTHTRFIYPDDDDYYGCINRFSKKNQVSLQPSFRSHTKIVYFNDFGDFDKPNDK